MHHNSNFDVTIEKRNYDIKNLIAMWKACGPSALLNWTYGQGKYILVSSGGKLVKKSNH